MNKVFSFTYIDFACYCWFILSVIIIYYVIKSFLKFLGSINHF